MTTSARADEFHNDIIYPNTIPFIVVHLVCFAAIWTGVTWKAALIGIALYWIRMFGVTGGYHRYFSHRSFKTGRFTQFVLAFIAQSSTQKNVLWWAGVHRHHHKHSDTELDVHSPRHRGFLYSHFGWIFDAKYDTTDAALVPDLAKYPELRFLQRFEQIPSLILAVLVFRWAGWSGLIVGFFWSTVVLYHCTFFINSLAHVHGKQRYVTGDDSRNNWWLAVITMGEGWHNNHHAYQRSVRQGFRWYEVDVTFYILTALSWMGLVWDLGKPPIEVVRNERPLGRATVERIAKQLAESFDLEHLKQRLPHIPTVEELRSHLPTMDELRARARDMIPHTPSLDEICARAREMMEQAMAAQHLALNA